MQVALKHAESTLAEDKHVAGHFRRLRIHPRASEPGRVLRSSGISIEKRAAAVDRLSAVILLQSYLDSL